MLNSPKKKQMRRPGRRRGQPDTREAILSTARALFAAKGVSGTSVRAVAAKAGVDPSLVLHFFGTKAGLFEAALQVPVQVTQLEELLQGPRSTLGERVVRFYVTHLFREQAATISSLMRSATSDEESAARLRLAIEQGPIAALQRLSPEGDRSIHAEMAGATMIGLFFARKILGVEPLASLSDEALVALYGPIVQRMLAPPAPRRSP